MKFRAAVYQGEIRVWQQLATACSLEILFVSYTWQSLGQAWKQDHQMTACQCHSAGNNAFSLSRHLLD